MRIHNALDSHKPAKTRSRYLSRAHAAKLIHRLRSNSLRSEPRRMFSWGCGCPARCRKSQSYAVYIHIPFCKQKCFYCDFPSFAGKERLIPSYLRALEKEIVLVKEKLGTGHALTPETVYIGGGTPSCLSLAQLEDLFVFVAKQIDLRSVRELTLEVNPGTADEEKLRFLKDAGVNRLSIGVQSFDDTCLRAAGRIHASQEAVQVVKLAQKVGFGNISIDLMYGLPEQDLHILQKSVARALDLGVQHISIYGLQVEEETVFAQRAAQGILPLPDDDTTEKMYDYITKALPEAGYRRYEISNFALRDYESQHNLAYWRDVPYLGFGAGAHGYWQGVRYQNSTSIEEYIAEIGAGGVMTHVEEKVTREAHMEEFCFLGLRTAEGISKAVFQNIFQADIHEIYGAKISTLIAQNLLAENGENIFLTDLGMKYGNKVFAEFLLGD